MRRSRVGAAFLAASLACGLAGSASARTSPPARYGGTLTIGLSGGDVDTLDPVTSASNPSQVVYAAMCQRLYGLDAKLQLVPVLAAAAPSISKDKLTYTIELRKGAQFNDGTPFNAQAVVTSAQRYMTYPGASIAGSFANVDSVNTSGPYTVVYHLTARDSSFLGGNPWVESPTQLAKIGDSFGANPVCVGPFMFDHRDPGVDVTLIKSPYYYDRGSVYLDKIVYKPMLDAAAATAALKAGDIQALDNVSSTELQGVRETSSLRVIQTYRLGWFGIVINIGNKNGAGNPPYANVGTPLASSSKLRQAFEAAIDRNAMNRVVYGGQAQVSCTPTPPANTAWYDVTKIPCTPYDPAHARKLVAQSGFPNPTVHLLTRSATDRVRLAQFIQAQEAAVGINVVIDTVDTATDIARRTSGSFDTELTGNSIAGPDPDANISRYVQSSGVANYSGYANPRLDLILANGLKATSIQARSTLYHVAQQIIAGDRPIIYLYNPNVNAAFSTSLTGVQLAFNGLLLVANARYR